MATNKERAAKTEQANFRLTSQLIERMEAYKNRHPLHPTLTQIVEASVESWLDANEHQLPSRKPKKD